MSNTLSIRKLTMLELILAMAILSIVIVIVVGFFGTVSKSSEYAASKAELFENAQIAMDIITSDLQSIYFGNNGAPFFHSLPNMPETLPESWENHPPTSWGVYRNELLAFVSATNFPANDKSQSKLFEIKYQLHFPTSLDDPLRGWLKRSVTGDKLDDGSDNSNWNWLNNTVVSYKLDGQLTIPAITVDSSSSEEYGKLIPHVTSFSVTCYNSDGSVIAPTEIAIDEGVDYLAPNTTNRPSSVKIELTTMSGSAWEKWKSIGGIDANYDSAEASYFRKNNEYTFSKLIHIGERVQPQ